MSSVPLFHKLFITKKSDTLVKFDNIIDYYKHILESDETSIERIPHPPPQKRKRAEM